MSKKNILIVDDFQISNEIVAQSLRQEGYNIITARKASEALEYFQNLKIDLIITDYVMPEINGVEFIEQVRNSENNNHVPIIMLTSMQSDKVRKKALEKGLTAWIQKPYNAELVIKKIKQLLKEIA